MSRLSREKKREQKRGAASAAPQAPIEVRVPVPVPVRGADGGEGAGYASVGASVGGAPVAAADGEEIQQAVLNRLHGIALASGHPVLATIHDDRMGYVIPLRVDLDGSSHLTADPVPLTPPAGTQPTSAPPAERPAPPAAPAAPPAPPTAPAGPPAPGAPAAFSSAPPATAAPGVEPPQPPVTRDQHTHVLRPVPEPVRESAPTFRMRALPEPEPTGEPGAPAAPPEPTPAPHGEPSPTAPTPHGESAPESHGQSASAPQRESSPTFRMRAIPEPEDRGTGAGAATFPLRAVPAWAAERESSARQEPAADAMPPGTVAAPTGAFGPPPRMDAGPPPAAPEPTRSAEHGRTPESTPSTPPPAARPAARASGPAAPSTPPPAARRGAHAPVYTPTPDIAFSPHLDPDPKPTPARGFDAVAEAVLGDEPITAPGDDAAPALLAEPMGRINDAVRGGRTEEAARLAEETVAEASGTLGTEHPEVLRLQELTAYIAYLAGEPVRALRLSLELAGVHRRLGDAEAAYGNVQSAATAWRAVRDPARGLELGRELIDLWTGLAAGGGPAADEIEQLDSVRTRMERLAQRARASEG